VNPGATEKDRTDRSALVRAFAASLSGTSLEWYDFALYSSAAALVFGKLFFPNHDPLSSTLLAFSTYAVGYVSRPLGGIVFGRLGDVIGCLRVVPEHPDDDYRQRSDSRLGLAKAHHHGI